MELGVGVVWLYPAVRTLPHGPHASWRVFGPMHCGRGLEIDHWDRKYMRFVWHCAGCGRTGGINAIKGRRLDELVAEFIVGPVTPSP